MANKDPPRPPVYLALNGVATTEWRLRKYKSRRVKPWPAYIRGGHHHVPRLASRVRKRSGNAHSKSEKLAKFYLLRAEYVLKTTKERQQLWEKLHTQLMEFWRDLAKRVADDGIKVAMDVLQEALEGMKISTDPDKKGDGEMDLLEIGLEKLEVA